MSDASSNSSRASGCVCSACCISEASGAGAFSRSTKQAGRELAIPAADIGAGKRDLVSVDLIGRRALARRAPACAKRSAR
jgi:hypothetical protein